MPLPNLNPFKQLFARFKKAPPEPELPPIKPPDFVQIEDNSPVGTWVGVGVAGAAMVMGLSFLGNRSTPAPKSTPIAVELEAIPAAPETIPVKAETKAPIVETKPSLRETIPVKAETKAPIVETKPSLRETKRRSRETHHRAPATPKHRCADGTTVQGYTTRKGTHVSGHKRGCPDGNTSNNKRSRRRTN